MKYSLCGCRPLSSPQFRLRGVDLGDLWSQRNAPRKSGTSLQEGDEATDASRDLKGPTSTFIDSPYGAATVPGTSLLPALRAIGLSRPYRPFEGFFPASMDDQMLEVVAIEGVLQLGLAQMSLANAHRLCQCNSLTISSPSSKPLPLQVSIAQSRTIAALRGGGAKPCCSDLRSH